MIARIDGRKCAIKCKLVQDDMTRMREITLKEKSSNFVLISPNHPSLFCYLRFFDRRQIPETKGFRIVGQAGAKKSQREKSSYEGLFAFTHLPSWSGTTHIVCL